MDNLIVYWIKINYELDQYIKLEEHTSSRVSQFKYPGSIIITQENDVK